MAWAKRKVNLRAVTAETVRPGPARPEAKSLSMADAQTHCVYQDTWMKTADQSLQTPGQVRGHPIELDYPMAALDQLEVEVDAQFSEEIFPARMELVIQEMIGAINTPVAREAMEMVG